MVFLNLDCADEPWLVQMLGQLVRSGHCYQNVKADTIVLDYILSIENCEGLNVCVQDNER